MSSDEADALEFAIIEALTKQRRIDRQRAGLPSSNLFARLRKAGVRCNFWDMMSLLRLPLFELATDGWRYSGQLQIWHNRSAMEAACSKEESVA